MTKSCPTCEHISGPDATLCNCETDTSLCERAFPDFNINFDVSGLTDMSYQHDTCPSWRSANGLWQIYTDYADNDRREIPDGRRFAYHQLNDNCDLTGDIYSSDDWDEVRKVTAGDVGASPAT